MKDKCVEKPTKDISQQGKGIITGWGYLRQDFPELAEWLNPLCRYNKRIFEDFIIADYKQEKKTLKIEFYTKEHSYHINAIKPGVRKKESFRMECGEYREDKGYLGCIGQCRKPRAGEKWTRGNDLADGSYCEETFRRIINDIVAYELVKVVKKNYWKEEKDDGFVKGFSSDSKN